MSATPVSICSSALLMLGDEPISDFDDGTDRARMAANNWEFARDWMLRRHPWNCATQLVQLAPDVTAPAFGYTAQFSLPADCLRVLFVGLDGEKPPYKVIGRKIMMNATVCNLTYIFRNEVPATWDASLVMAMTAVMRAIFAYAITQSGTMEQAMEAAALPIIREARSIDGQEDPNDALDDSPLFDARFIGGGNLASNLYRGPY